MEANFKQDNKLSEKSSKISNNKNDKFAIRQGSEFNKNQNKNDQIYKNDSTNDEMNKENNSSLNESNKSNNHNKFIIDKNIFSSNDQNENTQINQNIQNNQNNQNSYLNFYNFPSQNKQKNQLNIRISLDDLSISQFNNDNQNQYQDKSGKNFFENYFKSNNNIHKLVKEDEKMSDSVNDKMDYIEEEEEEEDDYDDGSDSTYKNYQNYSYYKNNKKKKKRHNRLKKNKNKHFKDNINNNKKEKFHNKNHIIKIELTNNNKNNNNNNSIIKNNNLNSNININNLKNELNNNINNNKNFENNNYNFNFNNNNNSSNFNIDILKEKSITNKNNNIVNYQIHLEKIKNDLLAHNSTSINNNNINEIYPNELSNYLHNEINEILSNTQSEDMIINNSNTYINCDLRYFNLDLITERIGSFDVVLIDPPWRIKGGQRNNDQFMFSNSKFQLDYNTLSNNDIISLRVETLSKKGFIFLWVLNSLLDVGINCLEKWGYSLVDELKWLKTKNDKVCTSQGFYFLHSTEICLVGYKCGKNDHMDFISKVWTDIIISDIQEKSKKPEKLYEIIEQMLPGSKKIELFARNHNLRKGWLSLGNELGMGYVKKNNEKIYYCSCCHLEINKGEKRYKSKIIGNCNLCDKCFKLIYANNNNTTTHLEIQNYDLVNQRTKNTSYISNNSNNKSLDEFLNYYPNHSNEKDFFALNNDITDEIRHKNIQCNSCKIEPINGLRFKCNECLVFNLCEECFDTYLNHHVNGFDANINNIDIEHNTSHSFTCLEIDELCDPSLAVHLTCRCKNCYMLPIIGVCFQCVDCKFYLCQNCYFNSNYKDNEHFGNNPKHKMIIRNKAKKLINNKYVKCMGCPNNKNIEHIRYKCDNCFYFDLCENCYVNRFNINFTGTAHKNYHTFSCYYLE